MDYAFDQNLNEYSPHGYKNEQFLKKIEEVRKKGYALDDEENELGVRCIAVSIPDYRNKPKYAFSISAPVVRMSDSRIQELSKIALEIKSEICSTMK